MVLTRTNDKLFSWCLRVWKFSFPIGAALAVITALREYAISSQTTAPLPLWYWVAGHLADFWLWALLTPIVLLVFARFPVQKKSWLKNGLIHLFFFAGLAAVYTLYVYGIDRLIAPASTFLMEEPLFRTFFVAIPSTALKYYGPIVVAGYFAAYYIRFREQEYQTTKLAAQLSEARLQALKMQLQPHFLFNTLHSISTLVYTDAKGADQMITQLSDLLRMTLDDGGMNLVPLRREIECASKYLAIEQTRFSDRLTVEFEIGPDTLDIPVPYLILQPIVENSIKHGVSRMVVNGKIIVRSCLVNGWLHLSVRDNGPGLNGDGPKAGLGLGLKNTRERLEQIYQEQFALQISGLNGKGTSVEIRLPAAAARQDSLSASMSTIFSGKQVFHE